LKYKRETNEYALTGLRHAYDIDTENRRFNHESTLEDKKFVNQLIMNNLKHAGESAKGIDPIYDTYSSGVNNYLNSLGFNG